MPGILANLAPFEPVKVLAIKQTQIAISDTWEGIASFDFDPIRIDEFPGCELPILSEVKSLPLLSPMNSVEPAEIPLSYSENAEPGILNPFSVLDLTSFYCSELFAENRITEVISSPVDPGFLKQFDGVKASENLFHVLTGPTYVSGINYADRYWRKIKISNDPSPDRKKAKSKNSLNPIDLHTINGVPLSKLKFIPSFWDLLFVLLQPPLDINSDQNAILPYPLYQYQIPGVEFLYSNDHALLADDMGTGKTVMTLVALKLLFGQNKITHALILCPTSVLYEWKKHISVWTPEIIAIFVRGVPEIRKMEWKTPAHIYVTSYDTLRSDVENQLIPKDNLDYFDVVIVDEAHHIKNPTTSRARAIKRLKPKRRWALTGTPIQNKLEDMISLFDFVYPDFLKPFDYTAYRIMEKVKPYFLRRRKQDVLKDLPPKLNQDIWLEMSEEQAREYRRVENGIITELEGMGENITKQHIFAKMTLLKQICNFPSKSNTSPKIDMVKDQIEEIIEAENKVIIFSQYVEEGVRKIEQALQPYGVSVLVGGMSDTARQLAIDKFKNGKKNPILIASIRTAGEGLNLTEASYVTHFDHWWNPAVKWQAEDRAHRKGQTQPVNVYSYWMSDTIDQRIYDILKRKGLLISSVVDGLAEPRSESEIDQLFSMDDLKEMIGLKRTQGQGKPSIDYSKIIKMDLDGIKSYLQSCSPREFEEVVGDLMHYLGYPNVRIVGKSGDGGIDVISTRNTGKGIEKIVAQCKKYQKPIGVSVARDFFGAISDDNSIAQGFLVTTSEFTSDTISFCIRNAIEMIDGLRMAEYVKQFGLKSK